MHQCDLGCMHQGILFVVPKPRESRLFLISFQMEFFLFCTQFCVSTLFIYNNDKSFKNLQIATDLQSSNDFIDTILPMPCNKRI